MLTPEQRQFYLDNGYLIVEDILSERRLQQIRQTLEPALYQ